MKAVFLDRDGVLNEEVDYLSRVEDLRVIPGAPAALRALRKAGYKLVVVSNQSGVARGYFTRRRLTQITKALRKQLGVKLDAVYYCVHAATGASCLCRKPGTQMIDRAKRRFKLDLSRSWLVGDSTVDMKLAENAGLRGILVRTGKGGKDGKHAAKPHKTFKDLKAAARYILSDK